MGFYVAGLTEEPQVAIPLGAVLVLGRSLADVMEW